VHIYLDEAGSFSGFHAGSISAVGALAIPDSKIEFLQKKYAKIRRDLPLQKGEVKGRLLDERQIDLVVTLLARNEVLFEVTVTDLGVQSEAHVVAYKDAHAQGMLERAHRFKEPARQEVEAACRQIQATSVPLYLQAISTFKLLESVIHHVPLFFAQRRPADLGTFAWIVDGKDRTRTTNWETWWSWYARGALATMSKRRPATRMEGADYSHFERFCSSDTEGDHVKLSRLLHNLRFSSEPEMGLELVDILVTATRRALVGNLQFLGWKNIRRLMVHRPDHYIKLIVLGETDVIYNAPHADVVRYFSTGGKSMLTTAILRAAAAPGM
jgi:hypothetical protein